MSKMGASLVKGGPRTYPLYGLSIRSEWPLFGLEPTNSGPADFDLFAGPARLFSRARREVGQNPQSMQWCQYARLPDGADYLRWANLFEFLISPDGGKIACRSLGNTSWEAFHTYLLGQVLSHALLKRGIEHLHATAVVGDEGAVGFVGDCGYGKSSLAAAFLKAGHRLLTDDLLVLKDAGRGFWAYPGPPRIKLFPEIAQAFMGESLNGIPMNPFTPKLIIPLGPDRACAKPCTLKAIFVLRPPKPEFQGKRVSIRTLSPRGAFLALIANTFNVIVKEPERLKGLFALAAALAASIPIKSLSYPRDPAILPEVVKTICKVLRKT